MENTHSARWVCFDVGETLIDETRVWTTWADVLHVPRFTFMAALGAVIDRGQDHREVFELVERPGWQECRDDFEAEYGGFRESDLYPDAGEAIDRLRSGGYHVAIFANQPAQRSDELRFIGIRPDLMAMSAEWDVHKPAPEFYARALAEMDAQAIDVAYVGDRLDNDVRPAAVAGMRPVWIRRGPWALIDREGVPPDAVVVDSLRELVERIDEVFA